MQTPPYRIPFNRPFIVGKELYYIAQAVQEGHLAGDGRFTRRCHEWLTQRLGAPRVLLTHSCTAALEMSAILCDLEPGDEFILPSYTFVSTANAFVLRGGRPRFADIRRDTLNLDAGLIEPLIGARTRVIVPVHYAGVACEMDRIMEIAARRGLRVVEDAAQAVNAKLHGRYLGTLGHLGCFSFHETKNFISGEGGAIVINDPGLVERAEIIREKGTNRAQFFRGQVDKYTWCDIGSSFLPSELVAAFLYAQLEEAETITRRRHAIFARYTAGLTSLATAGHLRLPVIPAGHEHNSHMFPVLTGTPDERDGLLEFLRERGILAVFHYVPLHTSPMGRRFGYATGDLPVTEYVAPRLLRLPCYFELAEAAEDQVIAAVCAFFGR